MAEEEELKSYLVSGDNGGRFIISGGVDILDPFMKSCPSRASSMLIYEKSIVVPSPEVFPQIINFQRRIFQKRIFSKEDIFKFT